MQVACGGVSPTRMCIIERVICDGEDDCGNGWDEDADMCGEFTYSLIDFLVRRHVIDPGHALFSRVFQGLCWEHEFIC